MEQGSSREADSCSFAGHYGHYQEMKKTGLLKQSIVL
jgi:hypothetical protein